MTGDWIEASKNAFEGWVFNIIGKGPSLDELSLRWIDGASTFTLCVNESIRAVESRIDARGSITRWQSNPIGVVQQDETLGSTCVPSNDLISHFINNKPLRQPLRPGFRFNATSARFYDPRRFGCDDTTLTAIIAVKLALHFGAGHIRFIAFDSWHDKSALSYCKGIPYEATNQKAGGAERFLLHRKLIIGAAGTLSITSVDPEGIEHQRSCPGWAEGVSL